MKRSYFFLIMAAVIVVATIVFPYALSFITDWDSDINRLKDVEVKDYNGTKLSSIADFRENSIKGTQRIDKSTYQLRVTGLVAKPASYSYGEVLDTYAHYEKVVTLQCVEGWRVTILWEGILLGDIIRDSAPLGFAKVVIFKAQDGYTTSFPLEYIINNDIIMAYGMNNVTLPPERGFPFQLVSESKWGYKWIKWVTEIELSDDTNYRGYWESRGYSNNGSLDRYFRGP